jgi:hypothetical protein
MTKPYCVISCPFLTVSGYGARARDVVKAIYELKKDDWQIEILCQRWGSTSWMTDDEIESDWSWSIPMLNKTGQLTRQPDYWFQITIPNECQPVGKLYNCLITAGIETTHCDPSWIDGCNKMDLILVSSNHAKTVFEHSVYDEKNANGQIIRKVQLQKPVEVLFEGADLNKYVCIPKDKLEKTDLVQSLDAISESFCFLFVGHWLQGILGQDRKNVGLAIKTFLETFKGQKKKPALILKTSGAGASIMDRDMILEKINEIIKLVGNKDLPNIYLLHGEFDDSDINNLYNHPKVKAMYCLTKGEGFGRPLLEFSLSKKPIIVSAWSGHTDFLDKEFTCYVPGDIKQIHPSAVVNNMLIPESGWFDPNVDVAKKLLKDVFENYENYEVNAKRQAHKSKTEFSFDKMKEVINQKIESFPKPVELKLPQLKKITLPQLKKV